MGRCRVKSKAFPLGALLFTTSPLCSSPSLGQEKGKGKKSRKRPTNGTRPSRKARLFLFPLLAQQVTAHGHTRLLPLCLLAFEGKVRIVMNGAVLVQQFPVWIGAIATAGVTQHSAAKERGKQNIPPVVNRLAGGCDAASRSWRCGPSAPCR